MFFWQGWIHRFLDGWMECFFGRDGFIDFWMDGWNVLFWQGLIHSFLDGWMECFFFPLPRE